jgi:hypothetical protein
VLGVAIDEEHRIAAVTVPERMLSLAIGREGQNARLAARLTGWRIDIRSDIAPVETVIAEDSPAVVEPPVVDQPAAADQPVALESPEAAAEPLPTPEIPEASVDVPEVAPAAEVPAAPVKRTRKKASEEVSS